MALNLKIPKIFLEKTPWDGWSGEQNPIWLCTSLILQRNCAKYKFPSKSSEIELKTISNLLYSLLEKAPGLEIPFYLPCSELSHTDKEFLFEHFLCTERVQDTGIGQGFLIDQSGNFLALLNFTSHLQMHLLVSSPDIEKSWAKLSQIENFLNTTLEFAFSSKFGYLTPDLTQCGTALSVDVYLHLPALIHTKQLSTVLSKYKDDSILITGLEGSLEDLVGDIVILSHRYSLGLPEEAILHDLQTAALKLLNAEKNARAQIKEKETLEIKDLISRSYGTLIHSYQIQTKEALNSLSLLKLGLDLEWITGASFKTIHNAFFRCQRGHLGRLIGQEEISSQEMLSKRAEFIHQSLEGIALKN